jgi:hypothetical protein
MTPMPTALTKWSGNVCIEAALIAGDKIASPRVWRRPDRTTLRTATDATRHHTWLAGVPLVVIVLLHLIGALH